MLDRVDTSPGNIFLHNAAAEETPFDSGRFHLVTAYSFLHHTDDFQRVMREAHARACARRAGCISTSNRTGSSGRKWRRWRNDPRP